MGNACANHCLDSYEWIYRPHDKFLNRSQLLGTLRVEFCIDWLFWRIVVTILRSLDTSLDTKGAYLEFLLDSIDFPGLRCSRPAATASYLRFNAVMGVATGRGRAGQQVWHGGKREERIFESGSDLRDMKVRSRVFMK